jgi:hypothetical protein
MAEKIRRYGAAPIAFAALIGLFGLRRRGQLVRMLMVLVLLSAGAMGLSGCSKYNTPTGMYSLGVQGAAGGYITSQPYMVTVGNGSTKS